MRRAVRLAPSRNPAAPASRETRCRRRQAPASIPGRLLAVRFLSLRSRQKCGYSALSGMVEKRRFLAFLDALTYVYRNRGCDILAQRLTRERKSLRAYPHRMGRSRRRDRKAAPEIDGTDPTW